MKYDCTLLVSSCDAYEDILDIFFELLHKYWPSLNYQIILSTETLNYCNKYFNIINIHPQNINCAWTTRISECLKQIKSKYVILILDDFFLYDYVNVEKLGNCLNWMENESKITSFIFYPIYGATEPCNYEGFRKIKKETIYNTIAAILGLWRKNELLKYMEGHQESIWEWEKNATEINKNKYKKDEIYITKNIEDNIFPYDFAKYGLFSGQWLKPTKKMFDNLKIKVNYNKRGFYNEALRGITKSISQSFYFDSAIIPNYNLKHRGSSYIKYKTLEKGKFIQIYNIKGAKDIIRWEPATQWGFSIEDLVIKIIYNDGICENINNLSLFGNFIEIDGKFVFNTITPYVYIVAKQNKKMKKIIIKGKFIFPLDAKTLTMSFQKETKSKSEKINLLINKIYNEFLVSKEKLYYIDISPTIKIYDEFNNKNETFKAIEYYKKNKFYHKFKINLSAQKVIYSFNDKGGYCLKKLSIKLLYKNGKCYKIKSRKITGKFNYLNKKFIFIERGYINIPININVKEVIVSGKFLCPIKSKILRKILYK